MLKELPCLNVNIISSYKWIICLCQIKNYNVRWSKQRLKIKRICSTIKGEIPIKKKKKNLKGEIYNLLWESKHAL